ncbi:MAG: butyrate kinase [Bacillales bacterium]|jgi:butyrate kinase|nr:butyrate kinase [Bacillales bacterium]
MNVQILAINPGSTSTKIAVYENDKEIFCKTLSHSEDELEKYSRIQDQFEMRKEAVLQLLQENGFNVENLCAVVGRGGLLPPVKSGAYIVNDKMIDRLKNNPIIEHASNLGALIAYEIASSIGKIAYIYDSVCVDELHELARISGMPDLPRRSAVHALNSRAMAMKVADKVGKSYSEMNLIVAHLGGGISISLHEKGRMVDIVSDDEGPFSPERAGRVPCQLLIDLCYSGKFNEREVNKKLRGNGGLKAYLGTTDAREIERRIDDGDEYAKLVYEAMAYQVAKGIGELATVVDGKIDAIVLTGGIAYSDTLTSWIRKRVAFIAPVEIIPGENEMESLARGVLRVLSGEEVAREYKE